MCSEIKSINLNYIQFTDCLSIMSRFPQRSPRSDPQPPRPQRFQQQPVATPPLPAQTGRKPPLPSAAQNGKIYRSKKWARYVAQIESVIKRSFTDQQQQANNALNAHLSELEQLRNDKKTFDKTVTDLQTQLSTANAENIQWKEKCDKFEKDKSKLHAQCEAGKRCADNIVDQLIGTFGKKRKITVDFEATLQQIDDLLEKEVETETEQNDSRVNDEHTKANNCAEVYHSRLTLAHATGYIDEKSYSI